MKARLALDIAFPPGQSPAFEGLEDMLGLWDTPIGPDIEAQVFAIARRYNTMAIRLPDRSQRHVTRRTVISGS